MRGGWKEVEHARVEGRSRTFLPFSFFTAASGIGKSTLLQAKLTGIPFGPRGPLDPDFPRWPL